MDTVIRARELTKYYGSDRGVSGLDFEVEPGEVFGFLGPNGAGKTTTIRLMLDLIRPSAGSLEVLGLDAHACSVEIRRRLGYLPGDLNLYERLTAREQLRYFAAIRGLSEMEKALELAERFELELDRQIRSLSKGNRQKIGLVQAFMHGPELLLLDEPTAGLDPLVQITFNELLREVVAEGRAVFLSSHILSEVQRLADRVAIIRDGSLELVETVEALRSKAFVRVQATFAAEPPEDAFTRLPGVRELERKGPVVLFALEGSADRLVKALARYEVLALDSREADLEDFFLTLYREGASGAG
jgi:ABC-2 type transport system ATP-binding protein